MSELPDSWVTLPIGDVNQFTSNTINPALRPSETFEVYSIPSFPTGKPERLLGGAIGSTKQTVVPGDVLISKINPRINRVWTVGANASELKIASSEWIGFRSDAVQPAFANYYFKSPGFRDLLCSDVTGVGGSLTRAQPKRVAAYPIAIAPRTEQTRIADQLDTLLARINACNDHLDAIPGILKRFRQTVLSAAVSGRLTADWRDSLDLDTAKAVDGLWPIPAGWRWADAKDECGFITKGTTPSKDKMRSGDGQVPYIKVYNLGFNGKLDFTIDPTFVEWSTHTVELKRSIVLPGDVLMNIVGPPLGKVSIVPNSHPEWNINQAIARFRAGPNLRSEFLAYCLLHSGLVSHAVSQSKATAGQWNLTLEICRSLPIPVPLLAEQDEAIRRLKKLMLLADRIEARHASMRIHTRRLAPRVLAKAFRGELVEQDPRDEPASVLLQRLAGSLTTKAPTASYRPRPELNTQPSAPDRPPISWASLPNGAWAAPADPDGQAATIWLTAVLRSWERPMPELVARLAVLLCLQPRLFTLMLTDRSQATLWSRLVGDEAKPLPSGVTRLQTATDSPWGRVIQGMRARGDLIEAGDGVDVDFGEMTWALGPSAASIDTAGWPDGRAGFVVAHLRAHGITSILPALDAAAQEFIHARAA